MKTNVLRPGLLVSLSTRIRGGVSYARVDLEPDHATDEGARRARWETTREITDAAEFEAATVARSKARSVITATCCPSSFGLLCPSSQEFALGRAIDEAKKIAQEHNATARTTQIDVFILVGRIAQDDAEALRAVSAEVRELLETMQSGIKTADPEAIREAATKARQLGAMLTTDAAIKVTEAITQARAAARAIVARVQKAGETAADVVKELRAEKIDAARFAFLDMDAPAHAEQEAPAARGIDLPPEAPATRSAAGAPQLPFALEV